MFMAAFIIIDGTMLAFYTVLCALWHELWHIIAVHIIGGKVKTLSAERFSISLSTASMSYKQEAAAAIAGPAASFAAFIFFALIARYTGMSKTAVFIAASNLALFTVNILPVFPLDGGRVLLCLLCQKLERDNAVKITKLISGIFLLPLCGLSVIILIESGYNLSLIIICVYLLLLLLGVINI